jgi:hypothetical protein
VVAVLAVTWLVWAGRRWRGHDRAMILVKDRTLVLVFVLVLVFGVIRNTPWGAALAP